MKTIAQILPQHLAAAISPATTQLRVSDWKPALDCYEPSLAKASRLCGDFIAAMASGAIPPEQGGRAATATGGGCPYWLTFTGVPGCGKTYLARQLFERARLYNPGELQTAWVTGTGFYDERKRRPRRVWLSATEFADRMRDKEYDLPEYLGADFLVVLDDLGAARDTTAFIADAVYRLCNARLGKWTIFTSNFSAAKIAEQIDPRVASRMIRDGNVAHRIEAPDYAFRQKVA